MVIRKKIEYFRNLVLMVSTLVLQSCYCSQFAGSIGGLKEGYFSFSKSDSIDHSVIMEKLGNDYPNIKLDSSEVNKYFKDYYFDVSEKKQIFESNKLYPLYPVIRCPFKDGEYCSKKWFIKSPNKDLIYELNLYNSSFSYARVHVINGKYRVESIGRANLCEKSKKERKRLSKEYISRFESEIIPLMEPYFKAKSK